MDYFLLNLSASEEDDYCFLFKAPEMEHEDRYALKRGEAVADGYPNPLRVYMDEENPGIKLSSLIGNARGMLIVDRGAKEAIDASETGPIEFMELEIYNHKRRLASSDYFVVNPIGRFDCLNLDESEVDLDPDDEDGTGDVEEAVLDAEKLEEAPDIFRIQEDPAQIVVSHKLVTALKKKRCTNFLVRKLKQA